MKRFLSTTAVLLAMSGTAAYAEAHAGGFGSVKAEEGDFFASDLIGMRIYNSEAEVEADARVADGAEQEWDDIGEINDLIVNPEGEVTAVVLGVGGFLGIGERDVTVSMDEIKILQEEGDAGDRFLVVNTSKEMLEQAPAFERSMDENMENAEAETEEMVENAEAETEEMAAETEQMAENAEAETEQMAENAEAETEEMVENAEAETEELAAETEQMAENAEAETEQMAENAEAETEQMAENAEAETEEMVENAEAETEEMAAETEQMAENAEAETEQMAENAEAEMEGDSDVVTLNADADAATDADREMLTRPSVEREGYAEADMERIQGMTAEELEGTAVYGANDETVGEIDDLVVSDDGKVTAVVINVGGFLGLGEKPVQVTFEELQILQNQEGDDLRIYIDSTEEALEALPEYED